MDRLWYKDLFSDRLWRFWVENYFSECWRMQTEKEARFLKDTLKGKTILDLCCGPGRHSVPLSSCFEVVSFDLSKHLLSYLKDRCASGEAGRRIRLVEGDMRRLPFRSDSFNGVINLQTSFGYFSDEENELVLKEVCRVLRPGGIFVLDIVNPGWLTSGFQRKGWSETDSFYLLEERNLDWSMKRMRNLWVFVDKRNGEIIRMPVEHRLYDANELNGILMKMGFKTLNTFGSYEGEGFDEARSPRIIILSEK